MRKTPDALVADEIETKLRTVPCVGALNRWERHYTFSSEPSLLATLVTFGASDRWYNYTSIDIEYFQAGFEEFRAGRRLRPHRPRTMLDDREYDLVFGQYDILTGTGSLSACGPNMGDAPDEPIVVR